MDSFTFTTSLRPQYRDLDPNGHVNQAVYASYFEQARADYWDEVIGIRHDKAGVALVKLEIEFGAEITLGEEITVHQRIGELGESSIPIEYQLTTPAGIAATGSVVLISYEREQKAAVPIPAAWRDAIEAYEGHRETDEE